MIRLHPLSRKASIKFYQILFFCCFPLLFFSSLPASADTTVGGTISTDTTWTLAGSPYIVTTNVTVQGADGADGITTLTIEPGVQIRMDNQYRKITIGGYSGAPGALKAQGTSAAPVVFTSNEASPAAGDWYYINFLTTTDDAATRMEHCVVEYGGYSQGALNLNNASPAIANTTIRHSKYAGIFASSSSPVLNDCTVSDNLGYGLQMSTGSPVLTDCTFSNNGNYDLYYTGTPGGSITGCTVDNGLYVAGGIINILTGNTINYNAAYPVRIGADAVGQFLNQNTLNNTDANSVIEVTADTIERDAAWNSAMNYRIMGNIIVQGTDGADGITTWTIGAGAKIRMDNTYRKITIGGSSGAPGALFAQGTAAEPVVFTSNEASPAAGDWYNINFLNTTDDATTRMEHCVVEYGGFSQGALNLNNASPTIANTTIRHSKYAGIFASSSSPVLNDCTVSDNLGYGLQMSTGSPVLTDCTFSNNGNYDLYYTGTPGGSITGCTVNNGIYVASGIIDTITGNTVNYNAAFPIRIGADAVGRIFSENTVNNLDGDSLIEVTADTIERDAAWNSAMNYRIMGNIIVQGTDGADGITTWTIGAGAQIRMDNTYRKITIGGSSGAPGALFAQGTAAAPVVFTSNEAVPSAGDWYNINFLTTTDDATTRMEHCVVEYGGFSQGVLLLNNASPRIQNTAVRYSKNAGIYATGAGTSTAAISCNTFAGNKQGIYWTASPAPEMHTNNFSGNTDYGIYYTGAATLNAEENWWGDAAGPNTGGDSTYGNVEADPWSVTEHPCTGGSNNYPPYEPFDPSPVNEAVHVNADPSVLLGWSCSDPNSEDTLTYDLRMGTAPESLDLTAQAITGQTYSATGLSRGVTYYWRITARDNRGLETEGPIWRFTSEGDPPDLIVSSITPTPAGGMQSNSYVTLTAEITNTGSGPVVEGFDTEFRVDGNTVATKTTEPFIAPGAGVQVSHTWYYRGGDPVIAVVTDSKGSITETLESNNQLEQPFSAIADITPPMLTANSPGSGDHVQEIQPITVTLTDHQSSIDTSAVTSSLVVTDAAQQTLAGTVSEANDTFTFSPAATLLPDGTYQVAVTATDIHGNSRNYGFEFTIDTVAPAKPTITGGIVSSGTIGPRPAQNTSNRAVVTVEGTRDADTSVWINGTQAAQAGSGAWSAQTGLSLGVNALEIYCSDLAGNISEPEWVDITLEAQGRVIYEYDAAGRLKSVRQ